MFSGLNEKCGNDEKKLMGLLAVVLASTVIGLYAVPSLRYGAASIPQPLSNESLFNFALTFHKPMLF
jgi:hypothetical protein